MLAAFWKPVTVTGTENVPAEKVAWPTDVTGGACEIILAVITVHTNSATEILIVILLFTLIRII
jgi:hypothetical protein